MKTYTVHESPAPEPDQIERADRLEFVDEGFSWVTAIFPPVGFAKHSQWLAIAGYVAVLCLLFGVAYLAGTRDEIVAVLFLGLNVFAGLELSTVRRWWLDRQGWSMIGTVSGNSLEECERRFFEVWEPEAVAPAASRSQVLMSHTARKPLPVTVGWLFGGRP